MENYENINVNVNVNINVPQKVQDIENRLSNTPAKPPKTPMKSFVEPDSIKEYGTPKSTKPTSSKSCSKLACSTPTPFSPGSVNTVGSTAREAARIAKMQSTIERVGKVAELKEKWAEEKKAKQQMSAVKRKNDLKKLQDTNSIAAENRRKAIESQRQFAERQKLESKKMLEASLEERKVLAADLEIKAKASRRISIFLNRKMKESFQNNEKKMVEEKKLSETNLLQTRTEDHQRLRAYKEEQKQRKRESMANRGVMTLKQREAQAAIEQENRQKEKNLLESKRDDHLAVREAKALAESRKRESMAGRTVMARVHRQKEEEMLREVEEEEKAHIETRFMNWADDHEYKAQEAARKRESMAGRNVAAVKQKKKAEELEQKARAIEADEVFVVRQQNFEDDRSAKAADEQRKRESLAGRLDVWRQQKVAEKQEEMMELTLRNKMLQTRREDWQDMETYKKEEEARDRESLAARLDKWRQERTAADQEKCLAIKAAQIEAELQQGIQRDVKEYNERLRQAARMSMHGRVEKGKLDREVDEKNRQEAVAAAHEEAEIQAKNYSDVKQYHLEQHMNERLSLEKRTLKARDDKIFEEELQKAAAEAAAEDARLRGEDYADVKEYQESLRTQARQSLEGRTQKAKADHNVDVRLKQEADERAAESAAWAAADKLALDEYTKELRNTRRLSIENNKKRLMETRQKDAQDQMDANMQAHLDAELEHLAWQDVQEYQKQMRDKARESLAGRLAAASEQHRIDLEAHGAMLSTLHDDLELRRLDWQQVNQHKQEDKDRRRKSMMLRNESAHSQRMAEEKLRAKKLLLQQEEIYNRELDREAVLAARADQVAQERADLVTSRMVV